MKPIVWAMAVLLPVSVWANGGGYLGGTASQGALGGTASTAKSGNFVPKNAELIEMQTEDLRIDLHVEFGRVEVEYTLHNPGKAVTAEVGFPCKAVTELLTEEGSTKPTEGKFTPPLRNFKVTFGEQVLDWKTTRDKSGQKDIETGMGDPYRHVPLWYTFKLPLGAGESKKLRVSYDTDYLVSSTSVSEDVVDQPEVLTYLFSTAAVWKGPIKQGKVTIRALGVNPDLVKLNLEKRFTRQGNTWTWEFTDFEPGLGDDLNIAAHPAQKSWGRNVNPNAEGEPVYADFVQIGKQWSLHHREYTATASSTLAPSGTAPAIIRYDASNVQDYDTDTAWVEGVPGNGGGESLTLTLTTPRKVSAIAVANGYLKSEDETLYTKNGRVAEFLVSINGQKPFTAAIPDERLRHREHLIPVPESDEKVKTIQLTINKVYPGSKYADTAISTITLITPLDKAPTIQPAR